MGKKSKKPATSYKDLALDFVARFRAAKSAQAQSDVLKDFELGVTNGDYSKETLRRAGVHLKKKYGLADLQKLAEGKFPRLGRGRTALQLGEEGDYSMMEDTERRPFVRTPGGCLNVKKGRKVRVRATDAHIAGIPDGPKIVLFPIPSTSRKAAS